MAIIDKIVNLKDDKLLQPAFMMILVSIVVSAMNYIYQVYMGRVLGPEDYGILGTLFALFYLVSVMGGTIGYSSTNYVSRLKRNETQLGSFLKNLLWKAIILAALLFSFFLLISNHLARFLKIDSPILLIIVSISLSLSLVVPVNKGALRGMQQFKLLATTNLASTVIKLATGIVLVMIGFGVLGATAALPISTAFTLVITTIPLIHTYLQKSDTESKTKLELGFAYNRYLVPSSMVSLAKTMVGNIDLILVKAFFSPSEAGFYAAASLIGKIILFLPGGIGFVFFPQVSERHADGIETTSLLKKTLLFVTVLAGTATIVYISFPHTLIKIVFGKEYLAAASLVKWYAIVMPFFTINCILLDYNLAKEETRFIYAFFLLLILLIVWILFFHNTTVQVVQAILLMNLLAFLFAYRKR